MNTDPFTPVPQEPRKSWPRRHKAWTAAGSAVALLVILTVIGAVAGGGGKPKAAASHPASAAPASAAAAPALPPPSPTPAPPTRVKFIVTGTGEPSIQYGSDSDNRSAAGGLGVLGDGNGLPWHASMAFDANANYYTMSAQLEGGGNISCKIVVTGPGDKPLTVSRGHAQGGYSICSAQATSFDGGIHWQSEG